MKIFAISVIYLFCLGAFATETREQILSRQDFYSGQSYSLIDWEGLDTVQWLDFDEWKDDIALKDAEPSWRRNLRERGLSEMVGRALECVGECKLFRGDGASSLRLRSQVMEGDEIVTSKDSYAWLFLMDGTMLRVSPNTSISFKEINISKDVVFHHARLNYGHALWLARQKEQFPINDLKETDALFLPLNLFEANLFPVAKPISESGFYVDQKTEPVSKLQYERLNQLIVENNEWAGSKKSILFLVMQNGTVIVENPMLEAVALPGNESYVKNRLSSEVGLNTERDTSATAYMRGYSNESSQGLNTGQWYRYDDRGRNLEQLNDSSKFSMVEYLTQRIPTINVARELFLKEISKFVFDQKISRLKLAARWGYRLWEGNLDSGEIKKRVEFMVEYSRRSETTLLVETEKFNRMMKERGEVVTASKWSDEFYLRAIDAYALSPERARNQAVEGETLNSTTKPLWKIMNARKNF